MRHGRIKSVNSDAAVKKERKKKSEKGAITKDSSLVQCYSKHRQTVVISRVGCQTRQGKCESPDINTGSEAKSREGSRVTLLQERRVSKI